MYTACVTTSFLADDRGRLCKIFLIPILGDVGAHTDLCRVFSTPSAFVDTDEEAVPEVPVDAITSCGVAWGQRRKVGSEIRYTTI